jgi:DNA-binding MarR family transcriptional regulator
MNTERKTDACTLQILEAIEERSQVTQRDLARHAGVALGLANSYLKRCVRKGLVKIQQAPANRYLYYLTPKGFAEKSRLTAQYLTYSLGFYRRAADSCSRLFEQCRGNGWDRVLFFGISELAEIASLRAAEAGVHVVGTVDPFRESDEFLKRPVWNSLEQAGDMHAVVLTELDDFLGYHDVLSRVLDQERILVPDILAIGPKNEP